MTFNPENLQRSLGGAPPCQHYLVGLSGGVDSVVLLHALLQLRENRLINQSIAAVHVNHGLHPDAESWQDFCQSLCQDWQVPLQVHSVEVSASGSLENAARESRYQIFEKSTTAQTVLLLAHHLDDQLETSLLRLLRGAGTAGLVGMPRLRELGTGHLFRPLLDYSRERIVNYATAQKLQWIEDSSNSELHHDRNYLRQQVFPLLAQRWPGYRESWSKSLSLLSEAAEMLQLMARNDLSTIASSAGRLKVAVLRKLNEARQRQLIRYWLGQLGLSEPGWNQLQQLVQQVLTQEEGTGKLELEDYKLQVYDGELYALRLLPELQIAAPVPVEVQPQARLLPNNGYLNFQQGNEAGLSTRFQQLSLRYRQGGETINLPGRPNKALKKFMQEAAIPPWLRDRIPLLYHNNELVCVPGIGIAEQAMAGDNEQGYEVTWQPPELEINLDPQNHPVFKAP